jgi:hypothetical protein
MRKALTASLALLLAAIHAAPAHALKECAQGRAGVEVKLDYVPPKDDTTLTAAQIDAMFRNDARSTLASDRNGIYVGVTQSPAFQGKMQAAFGGMVNIREDAACAEVKKVIYTVTYAPKVYIASDFLRHACRHGVTVMHEKRHVDAYLRTINEHLPALRKALEDYIAQMPPRPPVKQLQLPAERQAIMQGIEASLEPAVRAFDEANRRQQAEIDSPANYAHDNAVCPGEKSAFSRP